MNQLQDNQSLQSRLKIAVSDIIANIDFADRKIIYNFILEIDKYNLEKISTKDSIDSIDKFINDSLNTEAIYNFLFKLKYKLLTHNVYNGLVETLSLIFPKDIDKTKPTDKMLYIFLRLESITFFQNIKITQTENEEQ